MLSETLPNCICGEHNYGGGGGYVGPHLSYTCFTCTECKRGVMELSPWLFYDREPNIDKKVMEDYLNDIVIPFRRELREKEETRNIPPQLPKQLTAFYWDGDALSDYPWRLVSREESEKLPLPVDPIAVKHRERWAPIAKEVGAREIPNEYYNDRGNKEPWYEYKVGDATIKFGPRKRVISIQVRRDTPFLVEKIAELAKADDTTFYVDGHWQPWGAYQGVRIEVHAWTMEKFNSYLGWIMWDLGRTEGSERFAEAGG